MNEKEITMTEDGQIIVREEGQEDRPVTEEDTAGYPGMWKRLQAVMNGEDVDLPEDIES